MKSKLDYYRSLSIEERIALPIDQFHEYLVLLVEESNRNFHKCLENMENDDSSIKSDDCFSSLPSVLIPEHSYEELCDLFMRMPMKELVNEYKAASACSNCFYGVSEELVFSGLHEYIDAWLDVIRMVITERVCIDSDALSGEVSE